MFDKLSLKDATTNVKSLMEKVDGLVSAVDKIEKMLLSLLGSSLQNLSCANFLSRINTRITEIVQKVSDFKIPTDD